MGVENQKGKFLSVLPIIPLRIVQHSQPISSLSCSRFHPPFCPAVTSKGELYGLCVRTIEVSGEAEILLNASQHTWRNYASPASTSSTSRHPTLSLNKDSLSSNILSFT